MGHQYGRSAASVHLDNGDYEEALAAASEAIEREPEYSEHWFERASALAWLERYAESLGDFETARRFDQKTQVLEDDVVDDAYFSALLGAARAEAATDVARGCATLERYRVQFPAGRHVDDVGEWQERLRGERKSHFVKER
jgi:tetratricopeptide (TPR) repeat protein